MLQPTVIFTTALLYTEAVIVYKWPGCAVLCSRTFIAALALLLPSKFVSLKFTLKSNCTTKDTYHCLRFCNCQPQVARVCGALLVDLHRRFGARLAGARADKIRESFMQVCARIQL